MAAILAYTRYRWYPNEAEELLSEIANLDDKEYYTLIEAAIVSSREEHGIDELEERIRCQRRGKRNKSLKEPVFKRKHQ